MKTSDPLGGFRFAELYLLLKQLFNAHAQDLSDTIQFNVRYGPQVVLNPGYRASADIDRHSFQSIGESLLTELLFYAVHFDFVTHHIHGGPINDSCRKIRLRFVLT